LTGVTLHLLLDARADQERERDGGRAAMAGPRPIEFHLEEPESSVMFFRKS
jgi:hypothetical protein